MSHPKILVTGATGKTGGAIIADCTKIDGPCGPSYMRATKGASGSIKSAPKPWSPTSSTQTSCSTPCEERRGPICPPWHPYMLQSAAAFAAAAREARLEAIVGLTQWLAQSIAPIACDTPELARRPYVLDGPGHCTSGDQSGLLRRQLPAELISFAAQLGLFPWPTGESRNAPPSNEDIGRVAVAALMRRPSGTPDVYIVPQGRSFCPRAIWAAVLCTPSSTDV